MLLKKALGTVLLTGFLSTLLLSPAAAETKEERIAYAKKLEMISLKDGDNVYINAVGKDATTLKIKWPAMSRPNMVQLADDKLLKIWKQIGFKKITIENYESVYVITFGER